MEKCPEALAFNDPKYNGVIEVTNNAIFIQCPERNTSCPLSFNYARIEDFQNTLTIHKNMFVFK